MSSAPSSESRLARLRSRGFGTALAWAALTLVVGVASFWAGREATTAPARAAEPDERIDYEVVSATIGRTQEFATSARWVPQTQVTALRSGILTTVRSESGPLASGDIVLTIDLVPAVVATGPVPAFRDLAPGASGPDVEQLRQMLAGLGYLSTAEGSTFDGSTSAAVAAWRRDLGLPPGTAVELGLVYFVPTLPAQVVLGEGVQIGSTIQPGGPLFATVNPEPTFTVTLEPSQRNLVPLDAAAIVTHPEVTWTGKIAGAVESADGLSLTVTGPDGGPLCGGECDKVPVGAVSDYPISVVVVPETTGPVVPVAALTTDDAGRSYVTMSDGAERPVEVVAIDGGRCVIAGVEAGERLSIPAAGR